MNKKYLPSALILYLNYFIHGVGCSILGQAVIKEALAAAWGVEAMAITAISAALGLGRLIALPFAGPLSDKLGRRISTAIGSASYAIYLIGLALAFNAGTHGGYMRHYRRYRKLLSGYRYLPGSIRDYLQSSWRCYHGNQILHRNRSDAASICSWCSCYFYSSRPYLLQSVILRMRNCLYRTFCTGIPVPAARR